MTMRTIRVALLASALIGAPLAAQDFSPDRIRADVTFLSDDLLEGRNTGTRGYDLAAAYVANRFQSLGLRPGNGSGWYQQVPFGLATLKTDAANAITIGGQRFDNGVDVLMGGSILYPDQSLDAEVVFVGYGLEDARYGFDDYKGLDVRGKIVAYLVDLPETAPSDITATLGDERPQLAERKGALGTISLSSPAFLERLPWDRLKAYGSVPRLRWLKPDGTPHQMAPTLQVGGFLGPKATEALLAATSTPAPALFAAIKDRKHLPKGFAIPGNIRFERHSAVDKMTSPNVLGFLPGSDPTLSKEVILIMAHLDHDGIVPAKNGDSIMNGAMDNASGIAVMLEAARAFIDGGARPKRSIMFAALTAEEDGLLGAEYLAHYPVMKDHKVVGTVNLDMPILTYDFQDVIAFGAEHSTMGPAVERAVGQAGVKLSPDPVPAEGLFTRSDHYMFVKQGIPSVFLATGRAGPGQAAAESFLKNHYHQVSDDVRLPFDWKAAAKFARINYLIARELADTAQAPRWYEGGFFANAYAKDAPKAPRP
jgi:hypothetical protein